MRLIYQEAYNMAKRKSALTMPVDFSPALSDFMGKSRGKRTDVIKKVWAHIKKHGLQDENRRRIIYPDNVLSELIGEKPIDMFEMTRKISKHIG